MSEQINPSSRIRTFCRSFMTFDPLPISPIYQVGGSDPDAGNVWVGTFSWATSQQTEQVGYVVYNLNTCDRLAQIKVVFSRRAAAERHFVWWRVGSGIFMTEGLSCCLFPGLPLLRFPLPLLVSLALSSFFLTLPLRSSSSPRRSSHVILPAPTHTQGRVGFLQQLWCLLCEDQSDTLLLGNWEQLTVMEDYF